MIPPHHSALKNISKGKAGIKRNGESGLIPNSMKLFIMLGNMFPFTSNTGQNLKSLMKI